MFAMNMMIGNWAPGIGDPSFMGWVTVFSYYGSALLCLVAAIQTDKQQQSNDRTFWFAVFFTMAFLGVCKQFNLPSAITEIGRMLARTDGWMAQRRTVQAVVMTLFALAGLLAVAMVWKKIPAVIRARHRVTIFFLAYIVAFVSFRAISLHGWESVLGYRVAGLRINWIGELFGIAGVFFTAALRCRRVRMERARY